ncbi:MAG: methylenetetrahydrofolate--tRNA-(uracil(54)-C(5))-methyltransferase (FADH(2)-oxidizing) TrmFO [Candidatus Midichloria sp.]|uniref:tRNA uridine-5-carboxymethylaminomethyl(34) synthesis enzyme MnmG n=1 Tax=Hyalomma marginatum TaxID=34627 RepID=A0A8S4C2F8_9ACAR|nr:tRNA uridine-5-carboxymethylaminomethyl(34) synthesis enzyme MnmG [Hyalomma marginatum]CAG7599413.1 tRNA uridine-5-carboxymethylaminomethyl(34) synthesis enzyme MnmG [Hyalomma marginatum]
MQVHIIGAGLAGCEAAWQLAIRRIPVTLYEMRGIKQTPAHITSDFAELVCANSFRSDDIETAVGLLHEEMRKAGSLILEIADRTKVPAGSALAVILFAQAVTERIKSHPLISIKNEEVKVIPLQEKVIIATGPLTSDALAAEISKLIQEKYLSFFDAIAPIVYKESIDFNKAWFQSRYDKGEGFDYINCPLTKEEYEQFIDALLVGEKTEFKEWEKNTPYFDGCLPIEVMAQRGLETLRFGPMKPIGLKDPRVEKRPYAMVQLRQDNKLGTLYNIVGFQTKLKYGEQTRIFRMIPGLENAKFPRLGGLHRNTFINSPKLLNDFLSLKNHPNIKIAGQITGVEGYLESTAIGLLTGIFMAHEIQSILYSALLLLRLPLVRF